MGLWNLFIVALMPVVKLLLFTGIGLCLAMESVDILGTEARKHLNNLVYFVLNPAIVGRNLAKYITLRSIIMLWFIPSSVLLTFVICSMLGWLLIIKITKLPNGLRGLILGFCAAGNLGSMPLIIIPAVCQEKGSPFGDANICKSSGLAYASLSLAITSILMRSYVYNVVRIYSTKGSDVAIVDALPEGTQSDGETTEDLLTCRIGPLLPIKEPSLNENHMQHFELHCQVSKKNTKVPFPENIKQNFQKVTKKLNLRRLFAPSIKGAIVGVIIGIIPSFREALIGDSAPVHVFEDSAYMLGKSVITIVTLVVGAIF